MIVNGNLLPRDLPSLAQLVDTDGARPSRLLGRVDRIKLVDTERVHLYDFGIAVVTGSATLTCFGDGTVYVLDKGTCYAYGDVTVVALDTSTVWAYNRVRLTLVDEATGYQHHQTHSIVRDMATTELHDAASASVHNTGSAVLFDSSTADGTDIAKLTVHHTSRVKARGTTTVVVAEDDRIGATYGPTVDLTDNTTLAVPAALAQRDGDHVAFDSSLTVALTRYVRVEIAPLADESALTDMSAGADQVGYQISEPAAVTPSGPIAESVITTEDAPVQASGEPEQQYQPPQPPVPVSPFGSPLIAAREVRDAAPAPQDAVGEPRHSAGENLGVVVGPASTVAPAAPSDGESVFGDQWRPIGGPTT